jgi:hypothetical protein
MPNAFRSAGHGAEEEPLKVMISVLGIQKIS